MLLIYTDQGLAHPRRMGIATHLGILLDKPSVGCAKSRLYGRCTELGPLKGDHSDLLDDNGNIIGACLRTRDGVRPVYVSDGHKIILTKAIEIVLLQCTSRYRIPELLRTAHHLAEETKKRSA